MCISDIAVDTVVSVVVARVSRLVSRWHQPLLREGHGREGRKWRRAR